ncbi:MAG: restriction endonuclease subunit S [Aeromonas sp.]|uniref:restriction endonuclease subunit S n=1 Tax=Aeromonas sp. TaxID=647 RepID=UPI002FCA9A72
MSIPEEFSRFPAHWDVLPFTKAVKDATSGNIKIQTSDYLEDGTMPIVDQGQSHYGGFTDDKSTACKSELPTILFGDHTRVFKYIEEPFALGADGAKVLEPLVKLDKRFLFHYLKQLKIESAGYSRHYKYLKETYVPIPPPAEQQRIAALLDKADTIRQKREQAIVLAQDFLRSVFLDMFGDPVTNPNRWPIKKLGKIVDCINGDRSTNYPSGNDIVDSGVLFLSTKNIKNGHLDLSTTQYITMEKFKSLSRGKLQRNDLVITLRGTLAQSAIFDTDLDTGFINAQLMILRCSNDIHPIFLHALLMSNSFNSYLKSIGNGAAVPQLTAAQIKNLDIYLPPKAEQEKYIKISSTVSVVEQKQNQHLSSHIFNALSQKAFLGQL